MSQERWKIVPVKMRNSGEIALREEPVLTESLIQRELNRGSAGLGKELSKNVVTKKGKL